MDTRTDCVRCPGGPFSSLMQSWATRDQEQPFPAPTSSCWIGSRTRSFRRSASPKLTTSPSFQEQFDSTKLRSRRFSRGCCSNSFSAFPASSRIWTDGQMQRPGRQAGPAVARCGVRVGPDGAVHASQSVNSSAEKPVACELTWINVTCRLQDGDGPCRVSTEQGNRRVGAGIVRGENCSRPCDH